MKTIPYRCDNSRYKALLGAARSSGTSVQRLFDNFVTHVIAERQTEAQVPRRFLWVIRDRRLHGPQGSLHDEARDFLECGGLPPFCSL